jgi:hypothetical protein
MKINNAILYNIALFAYGIYKSDLNYSSTVPEDESIDEFHQISVLTGAFPNSESIATDTPDTTNEIHYAPAWECQSSVSQSEQEFCWSLAIIVLFFACLLICLKKYFHIRRVRSYCEDQMKQLKAIEARIREYEKDRAKIENNMESLMAKLLDRGRHDHFPNKMDSVKKIRKMELESDAQFQNEVDSVKTKMMNMEDEYHVQVQSSMKIVEEEEEQPGESHNDMSL